MVSGPCACQFLSGQQHRLASVLGINIPKNLGHGSSDLTCLLADFQQRNVVRDLVSLCLLRLWVDPLLLENPQVQFTFLVGALLLALVLHSRRQREFAVLKAILLRNVERCSVLNLLQQRRVDITLVQQLLHHCLALVQENLFSKVTLSERNLLAVNFAVRIFWVHRDVFVGFGCERAEADGDGAALTRHRCIHLQAAGAFRAQNNFIYNQAND